MGRQIREKENDKMDQFEMDKEDQRMEYQEMEYSRLEDMGQEKQDKEDGLMAERGMLPAEGREEKQDDTMEPVFGHHEGHLRGGHWNQHHSRCHGGSNRADHPHGVQKPEGSG